MTALRTKIKPKKVAKTPSKEIKAAAKASAEKSAKPADPARALAKASGGKVNPDQVRLLTYLDSVKPTFRANVDDLKDGVGIGRENRYSGLWLKALNDLVSRKFISCEVPAEGAGSRKYTYAITASGRKFFKGLSA